MVDISASAVSEVLDELRPEVRSKVRDLLRKEDMAPAPPGLDSAAHRQRVGQQMERLSQAGVGPQMGYPAEIGGSGDLGQGIVAFEMLAMGDISLLVKAGVHWGLFGGAVMQLGTEHHHARYGQAIHDLTLPGCFAMTETGHGSNVQRLETTATYDPASDELVVHSPTASAEKRYIGNAADDGQMAAVFAQLVVDGVGRGVHAVLVPIRDADGTVLDGVTIDDEGHKGGLNGVDNGILRFENVRVPRTNLLDRFGAITTDGDYTSPIDNPTRRFFTMLGTLVQGRTSIAAAAVSASKIALTIAVRYGEQRRQFAPKDEARENLLLDYQAHQALLIPRLAATYALHFAQQDLTRRFVEAMEGDDAEARREVESLAAGLKAIATWHCSDTIQASREACGGAGYLSSSRLVGLRADTDVFTTFEGANTVLLQLVAKGLLTGYSEEFSEMDLLSTVRFVTDKVLDQVVERLRAVPLLQSLRGASASVSDPDNLRDRGWHHDLLSDREEHVLETAAARLKSGMSSSDDPFTAFNQVQNHLLSAARAHVESLIFHQFDTAVQAVADDDVRWLLETVKDVWALSVIDADRGWFLEHGRLTPETTKAVTTTLEQLCNDLRPHALTLIDAFGVPDEVLPPVDLR